MQNIKVLQYFAILLDPPLCKCLFEGGRRGCCEKHRSKNELINYNNFAALATAQEKKIVKNRQDSKYSYILQLSNIHLTLNSDRETIL